MNVYRNRVTKLATMICTDLLQVMQHLQIQSSISVTEVRNFERITLQVRRPLQKSAM